MSEANIFKSLKGIWGADTELNTLLPSDRLTTQRAEGDIPVYPYAVITLITRLPSFRTSKGNTDRYLYQIAAYTDRHATASQIQRLMVDVLRDSTPTADEGNVVLFESAAGSRAITDGRVTQVIEQFVAEISSTRRA